MNRCFGMIVVALVMLCSGHSAIAADWYVDDSSPQQPGTPGSSWATAFTTLQAALAAAGEDDTIFIAGGTYRPAGTTVDGTFNIPIGGLKIRGGYQGTSGTPGVRNIDLYPAILDGSFQGGGLRRHIITVIDLSNDVLDHQILVEGVTIQNAYAAGGSGPTDMKGGGASIIESSVAFVRCKFLNCKADWHGGGIHVFDRPDAPAPSPGYTTKLDVVSCLFENCEGARGGGIANAESLVHCVNTIFRNCAAVPFQSFTETISGGGFANYEPERPGLSIAQFDACTFHLNDAENDYSLDSDEGVTTANNCIFWDGEDSVELSDESVFSYCISGNLPTGQNLINNSTDDPLLNSDSTLQCASPAINSGYSAFPYLPYDEFDLDGDSDHEDPLSRDYAQGYRVIGSEVDRGAIERQSECCYGNINGDGVVNINDLLEVINNWGACPGAPAPCPADIDAIPCSDGQVNINDLLTVINHWGECDPDCPGEGGIASGIPQSYNDCNNACSEYTGQEWADCMQACFKILCENGQPEYCDD